MSELSKIANFMGQVAGAALKQVALPSIVNAIESDHASMRKFMKAMKDEGGNPSEKKHAYEEFSELLKSHAKAEEKSIYPHCLKVTGMEIKAHEGFAEHGIAEELMAKIARIRDPLKWDAHVKVLAEMVEHHMGEEERSFLPALKAKVEEEELEKLRTKFLKVRRETQPHPDSENSGVLVA